MSGPGETSGNDLVAAAPDLAGTIEGWRVWHVVRDHGRYTLASVVKRTHWPARAALVAECLRSPPPLLWRWRRAGHAVPGTDCGCGIYATGLADVGLQLAGPPILPAVARVVGLVSLWGTVIECERGFRASHAYPLRIYVPLDAGRGLSPDPRELVRGLGRYGVPVELLPVRCANAQEALAQADLAGPASAA